MVGVGGAGEHPRRAARLIVPEHDNVSYERLDQTRDMFAHGTWRVRQADYENAPYGHAVLATSPYRWWLALVAWGHHVVSGRPPSLLLEQAALTADPLIHLLLLLAATAVTAWRFGGLPADLLAIGIATIFPLAGDFIPGAPEDQGMAQAFAFLSVLAAAAGIGVLPSSSPAAAVKGRRWFVASGVLGALGAWIHVGVLVLVVAGIAVGGLIAAGVARRGPRAADAADLPVAPWRTWALAGAATLLAAFLVEYFPAHMATWQLRVIHPLFGLAWLGVGEMLARTAGRIQGRGSKRGLRDAVAWALSIAAVAGIPLALWKAGTLGFSPLTCRCCVWRDCRALPRLRTSWPGWAGTGSTPRFGPPCFRCS